jgi:hypothetical protein
MQKLDLTKADKIYYNAKKKPEVIEIAPVQFLAISGKGDPSEKEYLDNIQALYATAYTVKFMCKSDGQDFVVPKLEGLWSFDSDQQLSMAEAPQKIPRSEWKYTMLIRMPDFVTEQQVKAAKQTVADKKQLQLAANITLLQRSEGKVVQMLHIGPFETEPETLGVMQEFITANNFRRNGQHHEIYLSDINRSAPEKWRTILREPVK